MNLFRIEPVLPPQARKTYQILAPIQTHKRKASCIEVGCLHRAKGWRTVIDTSTDLGARQSHYIRNFSGRKFRVKRTREGLLAFIFYPDQDCFNTHYVSLERTPFFRVLGGDYRGNPERIAPQRRTAEEWVDDFAEHQDRIARAVGQE